ncbi:oligosaccharide flippase family protein [Novosphingobium olei]|uniref:oligosaccharide flippase family protein n=1 Tax=Novosphingobium olei TaxID=2728851 RepID=UPI003088B430|nr:oligosaccharide flippase family protein [Novosphingobium olei]
MTDKLQDKDQEFGREPAAMSVRGAAVWAMAAQYLSFAVQFGTSVIISRFFLTPAEVGLFSIAMAAALVVSVLQDFGLARYISGLPVIDSHEVERCGSVAILFALAIAGTLASASIPLGHFYKMAALAPVLQVIAVSYLFAPLSIVPLALMARAMQFRGHFVVNLSGAIAQGAVALGLAASGSSSFALAWATVASTLARGITAQILRPTLPRRLRLDGVSGVLGFGARSTLLYLSGALGTRTPDLIVGKALGAFAVGLFSRAASLSDQFRMLISGAIGSVFYPAFARIRDRGDSLGPAYLRVCAGYSGVVWPGMAGLALGSEPLIRALYGPAWAATAMPLTMIALTEILLVALPLHIDLPILAGKLNPLLARNLVDTAMSIGLLAIGCHWGIAGAAASRLVYGLAWLLLYFGFMRRIIGFDVNALFVIYLRSAATTVAALAPLALGYVLWLPPSQMTFFGLALCSVAGAFTWLGALALVRHPALQEIIAIASHVPLLARLTARIRS